jgi:conjugative relaxase-like TrwC/TraI family protein
MSVRITPSEATAAQVKRYYVHHNSQEAYYSEGQDFNGVWGGKGAARLGLSGSLQEGAFTRLCDNLHPITGEKLTLRMKENRRVGYDVNFHVPKSVSLAYFYSKDESILQVARQAAYGTMVKMEESAAVRVRKGGKNLDDDRPTGEITYAEFPHMTARPVDGVPDPHLHIHCYVFNATYDGQEDSWKALQFADVVAKAGYYQKVFHALLSSGLKELGLAIENNEYAFEVGGIARLLIEKFSRRTAHIKSEAVRRGVTDADELDKLGALTRERKVQDVPISELEPIWWGRLSPEERTLLDGLKLQLERSREKITVRSPVLEPASKALGHQKDTGRLVLDAKGRPVSMNRATWPAEQKPQGPVEPSRWDLLAARFAVEHLFERKSVVTEEELLEEAFNSWSYGKATLPGVEEAIRNWPLMRVQKGEQTLITTQAVFDEEKRIVEKCKAGRGQYSYLNPSWQIENERLNAQQRDAVYHVLRSSDFLTGISGKAGTGKTTLLHEAANAIRASGRQLWVFAPTAGAARGTLREEGFREAETVAQLLNSPWLQKQAAGGVWWIDEAGLLSCRSMDALLELADKFNARVILVGDTGQHQAVERGQAFNLMQKYGELAVAEVGQVQRQKGAYKKAVELISEKNFAEGFEVLEKMGVFKVIELQAEREKAVAKDYVALREKSERVQVICPTHEEGRSVTQAIRRELREQGELGEGRKWHIHRNLSWTSAQKRDARHYEAGLMIQVNRPMKGFSVSEKLEVVEVRDAWVKGRNSAGEEKNIPLTSPERFNVYEPDAIEICTGDRIRITANGRSADEHPLTNGSCYTVREFTPEGEIVLNNGWKLAKDHANLDYGYVATSHAAQSKTVEWVLVVQSATLSAGATDAQQFYVSVSRGQRGVKIYTDNVELLRENVARVRDRKMAIEVIQEPEERKAREIRSVNVQELPDAPLGLNQPTKAGTKNLLGSQEKTVCEAWAQLKQPPEAQAPQRTEEQELELTMG